MATATLSIPTDLAGYDPTRFAGDCTWDDNAAQTAVEFIERFCTHVEGRLAGTPLKLEPWQADIVRSLFGWKRPDGTRRYRLAYVEVARKNGKTTLLAAVICYMLFCPEVREPGGKMYSAAADHKQASLVYGIAASMIRACPQMDSRATIRASRNRIVVGDTLYASLAAVAETAYGLNPNLICADELHVWPDDKLWIALLTGTAARSEPLTIAITTAGYDRESICYKQHDYAAKVRDEIIDDPSFLPVLYAADDEDDWTDPETWRKANPNLDVSISLDYLTRECSRAQESPAYENTFRRLHLNQWTEQDVRWIPMEKWRACQGEMPQLDGLPCYGGLDLGAVQDITAFVLVFPLDGKYYVKPWFWIPEAALDNRDKRNRHSYLDWRGRGELEITAGSEMHYDLIRKRINEICDDYDVQQINVDRLFQGAQLCQQLKEDDGWPIVEFGQGFLSMAAPSKEFMEAVLTGRLVHGGNHVLTWMASNAAYKEDPAGNTKPDKSKSSDKIDGIVATIMGVAGAMGVEQGESIYDHGESLAL